MNRANPLFADGDGKGFELVCGDALGRKALLLQQLSQQSRRRPGTASALDQEVEHLAFAVDRPPQPVFPVTNLDHHLVEMPACARPRTVAPKIARYSQAELQKPATDGLILDVNSALSEHLLDIAK